jgi:hypothetical protein
MEESATGGRILMDCGSFCEKAKFSGTHPSGLPSKSTLVTSREVRKKNLTS